MYKTADHTALLIVDMINDLSFPGGEKLAPPATLAARHIRALKDQLQPSGVPVIYANDNFGKWRSDISEEIDRVRDSGSRGRALLEYLVPTCEDYVVLKPRHSAFFATPLDTLLNELQVNRLILTGIATDSCILFSAYDAYMRGYQLWIPEDCTAAESEESCESALRLAARVLGADTASSLTGQFTEPELPF